MEISKNLHNILSIELKVRLEYRDELKYTFAEANELGDAPENSPLDTAKFDIQNNELRITDLEDILRKVTPVDDKTEDRLVYGSKFKAVDTTDNTKHSFIILVPDFNISIETQGFRPISPNTELGKTIIGKGVGDRFGRFEVVEML